MIYFVQATDGGPIKIGTTGDLDVRLKQLEAHYGRPLAVLCTMEGGQPEEAEIHSRFGHLRLGQSEQFAPGPDLLDFIGRPLFIHQDVSLMDVKIGLGIIHIKGTRAYSDWLEALHRRTHIPKAALFRLAMAEWAERNGHPAPPEF